MEIKRDSIVLDLEKKIMFHEKGIHLVMIMLKNCYGLL